MWRYIDNKEQIQGPFSANQMLLWYNMGFFEKGLLMLGTVKKLAPPHLPGELRAPVEAGILLRGGLSGSETGRGTLRGLTHAGLPNPPLARQGRVQALRGPAPRRQEDPPRRPRRQGEQQVAGPAPEAGGLRLSRCGTGEVHLSQMPRPYRHLHEAQRPAEAGRPQEHPGGARVFRGCTRLQSDGGLRERERPAVVVYLRVASCPPRDGQAGGRRSSPAAFFCWGPGGAATRSTTEGS